jgi:hypothetical protein
MKVTTAVINKISTIFSTFLKTTSRNVDIFRSRHFSTFRHHFCSRHFRHFCRVSTCRNNPNPQKTKIFRSVVNHATVGFVGSAYQKILTPLTIMNAQNVKKKENKENL